MIDLLFYYLVQFSALVKFTKIIIEKNSHFSRSFLGLEHHKKSKECLIETGSHVSFVFAEVDKIVTRKGRFEL